MEEDFDLDGGLNIFVLNTHEAIAQLPFTLILVPLNMAFGQVGQGEDLFQYLSEATCCVVRSSPEACGAGSVQPEWAGKLTLPPDLQQMGHEMAPSAPER